MSDEPGSPLNDGLRADKLIQLVKGLEVDTADGRAGVTALLRELEAEAPGFLARLTADLRMRREARALGLQTRAVH